MSRTKLASKVLQCYLFFTLKTIAEGLSLHEACVPFNQVAKKAFNGQFQFLERGLRPDVAKANYVEFISVLAQCYFPLSRNVWHSCVSKPELDLLVNEDGIILKTLSIVNNAENDVDSEIALLTQTEYSNLMRNFALKERQRNRRKTWWTKNVKSLKTLVCNEKLETVFKKVKFPEASKVRLELDKTSACEQYRRNDRNAPRVSTNYLVSSVLALFSTLTALKVDGYKARQILNHTLAYVNVGMRCEEKEASQLQVPLSFMKEYALVAACLTAGSAKRSVLSKTMPKTSSAMEVSKDGPELINLLTSFEAGGRIPKKTVSASEGLIDLHTGWKSPGDLRQSIDEQKHRTEISKEIMQGTVNQLKKKVLQNFKKLGADLAMGAFSYIFGRDQDSDSQNSFDAALEDLGISGRMSGCKRGYKHMERNGTMDWTEKCCSDVCKDGSMQMEGQAGQLFGEHCCRWCNQKKCWVHGTDLVQRTIEKVEILVPGCGGNCNKLFVNLVI